MLARSGLPRRYLGRPRFGKGFKLYSRGRPYVRSRNLALNRYSTSAAVQSRVYKARVAGRQGSYQIPRGFAGLAGDAKFIDLAENGYVMGRTDTDANLITYLNTIPQAAGVSARIGKAVRCQSLSVRGTVLAGTGPVANFHIYFVWDYQPNAPGAVPTWQTIFLEKENTSLPNRENNARFKILGKVTGTVIGSGAAPTTGQEAAWVEKIIPMPADGFTLYETNGTTGVLGECIQGALYMMCISDKNSGATAPTFTASLRLNFQDIN